MAMKLEGLPVHHIDTSIILEPRRTEDGSYCTKYLQKVGYNYKGILSMPVLSELFLLVLRIENYEERHNFLDAIGHTIKVRDMKLYSPKNIGEITASIRKSDTRIDELDAHIIACSIEDSAWLITLDRKLIGNSSLEKKFGIKILHPKDLL